MRYTKDEAMAVLGNATYPMTTAEILGECRLNAGRPRLGPGSGLTSQVRNALNKLASEGIIVSAMYAEPEKNPYFYIARPTDLRSLWWMAKNRAEDFARELQRRETLLADAYHLADRIQTTLPKVHLKVACAERSGTVGFKMEGSLEELETLARLC